MNTLIFGQKSLEKKKKKTQDGKTGATDLRIYYFLAGKYRNFLQSKSKPKMGKPVQ
jgi:hypothetical protein